MRAPKEEEKRKCHWLLVFSPSHFLCHLSLFPFTSLPHSKALHMDLKLRNDL